MATATQHNFSNGSLNSYANGKHATAHQRYQPHRLADDDDSIVTEEFPEFDPSHDGSEEDEHYTHAATGNKTRANGFVAATSGRDDTIPRERSRSDAHRHRLFDDDDDHDEPEQPELSSLDPTPDEPSTMTSPIMSPPYWAHGHHSIAEATSSRSNPYGTGASTDSLVPPGAITLQDNEAEGYPAACGGRNSEETRTSYGQDRNRACWAKSVEVTDYVIVNGSATNIGAFVVWNIRVQTLSGPYMNIRKRYSEFDDLRSRLIRTFPGFEAAVPVLPPKSVISKFRPRFLEKRRAGLQYFLNCIMLNPEFSGSPVLKDFLFS